MKYDRTDARELETMDFSNVALPIGIDTGAGQPWHGLTLEDLKMLQTALKTAQVRELPGPMRELILPCEESPRLNVMLLWVEAAISYMERGGFPLVRGKA